MIYREKLKRKRKKIFICIFLFLFLIWVYFIVNLDAKDFILEKKFRDIGVEIKSFFLPKINEYDQNLIEGINSQLEEENQELKKMVGFQLENYYTIFANVISRDASWYQEITLDKGEKDGIKLDIAVISNQGLIGRIIKVGYSSSVVKLLTANSNDMKVAVDIKTEAGMIHGILDGYLESESAICISNISKNYEIKIGDKVYTNGLGGIYPAGIYIGKIIDIDYDTLGLNKIAKLKADFSYDTLRYVTIVDRR